MSESVASKVGQAIHGAATGAIAGALLIGVGALAVSAIPAAAVLTGVMSAAAGAGALAGIAPKSWAVGPLSPGWGDEPFAEKPAVARRKMGM